MCEICEIETPDNGTAQEEMWVEVHNRLASLTLAHRTSALVDDGGGVSLLTELHRLSQLVTAELPAEKRSLVLALAVDLLARVQQYRPDLAAATLPTLQVGPYIKLVDRDSLDPVTHDVMNAARTVRAAIDAGAPGHAVTEVASGQALDVLAYGIRRAFLGLPDTAITVSDIGGVSGQMHASMLTLLAERLDGSDLYPASK